MRTHTPVLVLGRRAFATLFAAWFAFGMVPRGLTQTITWLYPTADGRYEVDSAIDNPAITVLVTTADGKVIDTSASLRAAGWEWAKDRMWQNPTRDTLSKRLDIRVSGLPPGRHKIYMRYFEMVRPDGESWWFFPTMYFGASPGSMKKSVPRDTRVIAGTGGVDRDNVYDGLIGMAGTARAPATGFAAGFGKYRWANLNRYGAIRIETELDIDAPLTLQDTPLDRRVRAVLLGNGPEVDGTTPYGLAATANTLKVRPKSFDAVADVELSSNMDLAGAGGEYTSRQILLHSPTQDLRNVVLQASRLTKENGEAIETNKVTFCPVGYVPVSVPYLPSEHGWWPEPILTFLKKFNVARGDVQSLWYQVRVPRDVAPGVYRGSVTVIPGNAPPVDMPVSLRVWDFSMPKMPYLRVVMGCGKNDDFEIGFGIQPGTIYGYQYDDNPGKLADFAKAGATAFSLGYVNERPRDPVTGKPTVPTRERLDELVGTIGPRYDAATKAGLRDACYVYMYDEAGPDWAPAMLAVAGKLKKEFPDLLLLTTSHSFTNPDLLQVIDGWVPLIGNGYDLERAREFRSQKRQLWWYTCNSPPRPNANLFLTESATAHRQLMGFMAFAYQTDGYLYYATQWAGAILDKDKISRGPYTDLGAGKADRDSHGWLYLDGPDGNPMPSMRMEAIRAGLQDFNYLTIARSVRKELQAAGLETPEFAAMAEKFEPYATPGNGLVRSFSDYVRNPDRLDAAKLQLGAYIESAKRALRQAGRAAVGNE